jgi:hypothetical protein
MRLLLPILLPAWLLEIIWNIDCADHETEGTRALHEVCHIEREGRVSTFMHPCMHAVDPNGRMVIDGTKVKKAPLAGAKLKASKRAAIPASLKICVIADSAFGCFWCEGHFNASPPDDL